MKITLVYLGFFALTGIALHGQSIDKDSISVSLSMPEKEISEAKQLVVDVKITSYKKNILEVPEQGVWGYALYHSGFLGVQVQRQVNGKFGDTPISTSIDSFMGIDPDTLRTNDSKDWSFDLFRINTFNKGSYRVRFFASLSSLNPVKDVYSDWYYFKCSRDVKPVH
jgi:hypothetical protein